MHVILYVLFQSFLCDIVSVLLCSPLHKLLSNLVPHSVHVEAKAADGDGGKGEVGDGLGRVLQRRHNLASKDNLALAEKNTVAGDDKIQLTSVSKETVLGYCLCYAYWGPYVDQVETTWGLWPCGF